MESRDYFDIAIAVITIAAIIIGPIAAVRITREIDDRRAATARKMEIFRALMKTRRERLAYEHVAALNLVEVEFYGIEPVINAYSQYIERLYEKAPSDPAENSNFWNKRGEDFAEMLKHMGEHLGYNFDKMDLNRLSYSPAGWENDATLNRNNQHLLNELLSGRRTLAVTDTKLPLKSPFPPPPTSEE
ncbi:MAG: hypothetical protein HRT81_02075 [Henriciella sp.]|nr:hypothetical protein [Henriciella sp.]